MPKSPKPCKPDQVRNPKTGRCNKMKSPKPCKSDQVRNPKTERCNKVKSPKRNKRKVSKTTSSKTSKHKSLDELYSEISVAWVNKNCIKGISIQEDSFVPEELRRHFESDLISQAIVKFAYPIDLRDSEQGADIYYEKALVFTSKQMVTQITKQQVQEISNFIKIPKTRKKALFTQTEYNTIIRNVIEQQHMFDEKHEQQEKIFFSKEALTAIHSLSEQYIRFLILKSCEMAKERGQTTINAKEIQAVYLSIFSIESDM
jgi:histone H3/H4